MFSKKTWSWQHACATRQTRYDEIAFEEATWPRVRPPWSEEEGGSARKLPLNRLRTRPDETGCSNRLPVSAIWSEYERNAQVRHSKNWTSRWPTPFHPCPHVLSIIPLSRHNVLFFLFFFIQNKLIIILFSNLLFRGLPYRSMKLVRWRKIGQLYISKIILSNFSVEIYFLIIILYR